MDLPTWTEPSTYYRVTWPEHASALGAAGTQTRNTHTCYYSESSETTRKTNQTWTVERNLIRPAKYSADSPLAYGVRCCSQRRRHTRRHSRQPGRKRNASRPCWPLLLAWLSWSVLDDLIERLKRGVRPRSFATVTRNISSSTYHIKSLNACIKH
jgi:hypothetical protein